MAWTIPVVRPTGYLVLASDWNNEHVNNLKHLHGDGGATIDVSAGGQTFLASSLSTGPASGAAGQTGGYLTSGGQLFLGAASSATNTFNTSVNGDAANRLVITAGGLIKMGSGAGAQDCTFGRLASGVLGDTATALSTGPTSGVSGGGGVAGAFLGSSGQTFLTVSGVANALTVSQVSDTGGRLVLKSDASILLGSGTGAQDTTIARASTGKGVKISNFLRQVGQVSLTYGTTVAIDASLGSFFTVTVTNTTAFTFSNPTNPPAAGEQQHIWIEWLNSSGGAMGTVSWGTAFKGLPGIVNPPNGSRQLTHFVWNGANWVCLGIAGATY